MFDIAGSSVSCQIATEAVDESQRPNVGPEHPASLRHLHRRASPQPRNLLQPRQRSAHAQGKRSPSIIQTFFNHQPICPSFPLPFFIFRRRLRLLLLLLLLLLLRLLSVLFFLLFFFLILLTCLIFVCISVLFLQPGFNEPIFLIATSHSLKLSASSLMYLFNLSNQLQFSYTISYNNLIRFLFGSNGATLS